MPRFKNHDVDTPGRIRTNLWEHENFVNVPGRQRSPQWTQDYLRPAPGRIRLGCVHNGATGSTCMQY